MLRLALASPLLLAACAAAQPPVHGFTPGHRCRIANAAQFVGQTATADVGAAILRETHAAVLRWAAPGVLLTMDSREDRVTVRLGGDRRVTAVNCG